MKPKYKTHQSGIVTMFDWEKMVILKIKKTSSISSVFKFIMKNNSFCFTPLMLLCLMVAIIDKYRLGVPIESIQVLTAKWQYDPTLTWQEEKMLGDYRPHLERVGFKIPRSNLSLALDIPKRKQPTVVFKGREVQKRITAKMLKEEFQSRQMSIGF